MKSGMPASPVLLCREPPSYRWVTASSCVWIWAKTLARFEPWVAASGRNPRAAGERHAAVQAQALDGGRLDQASSTDASPASPPEEMGALTRPDYTLVSTQLAALRREAAAASPALES